MRAVNPPTPPSEPCVKITLHTARAWLRPGSYKPTHCSMKPIASSRRSVVPSGRLAILGCGRLRCAPLGDSSGTHQATGVAHHLLFPVEGGSTDSLAMPDLADVGISGALPPVLASSAISMLCLAPCLAVGAATNHVVGDTAFPCSAFDTGGFRSALLHRQFCECAPGHVRQPGLDCLPFWLQP